MNKRGSSALRISVTLAMLSAISIVMGKYLAFNVGDFLRFSFESMPIIFAGAFFGPLAGMAVGAVADLIGCLLVGYAINPIITLGAAAIGLFGGLLFNLTKKTRLPYAVRIILTVGLSHIIGSVIIKSVGLSAFYTQPLYVVMGMRALNYLIIAVLEGVILYIMLKNKAILGAFGKSTSRFERSKEARMTYDEAIEYIHGISWTFCKPGLDRTRELCEKLGNPQDSLKFIHVAGTNGKGSFCSMLSSVLTRAGMTVGLYTSPYIIEFGERMQIDGKNIPNEKLAEITEYVKPLADSMEDKPTEFELITAIAFEYFKREGVDIVVLEAGLGGRLDSTNIIKTPLLSVITGISLDHTAILGDTVEKIAAEKAGIIKRGVPVLFGSDDKEALKIIKTRSSEMRCAFYQTDRSKINIKEFTLDGTLFDYKGHSGIRLSLLGAYQPMNAANVLEAIDILRGIGVDIPEDAVARGLYAARWPARFEVIRKSPLTIYDGAHNPEGVENAVKSIESYFGGERVYVVSGVLADKDYKFIAGEISKVAKAVFTITPENPRALSATEYAEIFTEYGIKATPQESVYEAMRSATAAASDGSAIVCLGSLYTYGDVIKAITDDKQ